MAQILPFGKTPDGRSVDQITLRGGGLSAQVLTYGAILRDLRLDGHAQPLVLGFETFAPYIDHPGYFGATVGPCANRIAAGRFTLNGQPHQLDCNNGPNHLHGGRGGISHQIWTIADHTDHSVTLTLTSLDGDTGYPAALHISLTISLQQDGVLDLQMSATSDAPTLCNLAHHSYFNLGGADILSHQLQINADHYLPVDAGLIPTGQIADVTGTPFDFRRPVPLANACDAAAIDHNFCLSHSPEPLRLVATLAADAITMRINTDQPGLQIYDAARMNVPVAGLGGQTYGPYAGIAIEPQLWPDAINHPDWAQPVLNPDKTYTQHSQFVFARTAP
ncbi:aldose epimerase family protein [Pseudorhodobacter ferrugineus]|uniref:aldose epimerase family protein n=1 Tax=Pseudorhodobacter ferrugineus TaxID=77008 RepID=UPI000421178D|nr:aldose epimerase family protein [Pseudorhodobacter ferrugineus]